MELIGTIITAILVLLVFYLSQMPAKRQEKDLKKMQEDLKENDRVITYNGLCGTIAKVLDDRVILKAEPDGVQLSIEKWAIAGLDDRSFEETEKIEKKEKKSKKEK